MIAAVVLACVGLQPGLAARRRGAKLYPDKETAADMSGLNRDFLGWVDLTEHDWAAHGYASKAHWAAVATGLNSELLGLCQAKYLSGKTVVGATQKGDENAAGCDLYIKFSDVPIDYNNYHLYLSIRFIDPKTNTEIGSIPARPYFGNAWGFVNYWNAALDEVSRKIGVEVIGSTQQGKRKPR